MIFANVVFREDRLARETQMAIIVNPTQVTAHAHLIHMTNALTVTHVIRLTMLVFVEIRLPALVNQLDNIVMLPMKNANVPKILKHVCIRKHVLIHMLEATNGKTFAIVVLLNLVQGSQLEVIVTLITISANVPSM